MIDETWEEERAGMGIVNDLRMMRIYVRSLLPAFLLLSGVVAQPRVASAGPTPIDLRVSQLSTSSSSTTFTLTWTPPSDPDFGEWLIEYEPCYPQPGCSHILIWGTATSPLTLTRTLPGIWRYTVVFGWLASGGRLQVTAQSNQVSVPTPQTPVLFDVPRPPLDNGFLMQWSNEPGTSIYQLVEDTRQDFSTPDAPQYWPRANREPIPTKTPGTYYYRVRAWNELPERGGSASGWSNVITVQILSDEAFLDLLEHRLVEYFLASTFPNGLTRDRLSTRGEATEVVSIAATGFYLSGLTVGAERGWMARDEASDRASTTLQTFLSVTPQVHGFFYHFLNPDGSPSETPFLEVSSIDTALFVAGALQAGEYFGGEVKTLADAIYQRVEWTWMFDPDRGLMRWGWVDEARGFYEGGYYDSYAESILLYLLAIGSPTHPIPAEALYRFARPKGNYRGPDFIFTPGGQLFTYQYAHAWYDFRNTTDALGVNWWQNSIEAVRASQRFAIDNPGYGYSQALWGLTSSDGPNSTSENPYGYQGYGAQPAYSNIHDGTIAPTGVGGSVALAPDLAIPSLKQLYTVHGDQLWAAYGFVDAFNPNRGWVDPYYIGIDQGIILLMLENRRSELIWRTFMQNAHVLRSLARAHFSGYGAADVTLEDFEDGQFWTPESTLGWWDSAGTTVYQRSHVGAPVLEGRASMQVQYAKRGDPWSLMGGFLSTANPRRDMSHHELLTLNVFGACDLLVKLRDQSQAEQDVAVLKSNNPNGWNRLVFDVSRLGVNTSAIDNVLLFVDPGQATSSGTLFMDQLRLETRKPAVIEDFEDGDFWTPDTSLGWWDIDGTRVYRRSQSTDPSHGGFGAMKVAYAKDGFPWSFFGGSIAGSSPHRDFTRYRRLGVWVYGAGD
ncbi:MAG: hypothetical protein HYY59_02570, partial [Candidatus Omnitrophica bacterium]|nr:hypothetical protein [Candidatus Omnitrophota bacterium]